MSTGMCIPPRGLVGEQWTGCTTLAHPESSSAQEAARTYLPDMRDSWALFFRQPAVLPSLAIVALFFNTAMAPTGVLTAFLTAQGMSGTATAVFRGACAALGLVGIWIGTRVSRWGS